MNPAERLADTDELIDQSERLRAQLIAGVERLESFVVELQQEVARRQVQRQEQRGPS
jgi:hypothetical protein